MFTTRKGLVSFLILFFLAGGFSWLVNKIPDGEISVSDKARTHILQGDNRGGGHKYGTGKPCKSEFPASWNNDEIIDIVETMAANDNLNWKKQGNGYYTAEDSIDGTRVRVVLNRDRSDVVTAYPLNTGRNPCPNRKSANDN